jgi:hypothetical protein
MFDSLEMAVESLQGVVSELDPDAISVSEAERLVGQFITAERLGAAGKTIVLSRLLADFDPLREGVRTPAEWLAARVGCTLSEALASISTASALPGLSKLDDSFRAGELSPGQAAAVAEGASADPAAEERLLDSAKRKPLRDLRDEVRKTKSAVTDEADKRDAEIKAHERRSHRYHQVDGGWRGEWFLPNLAAARLIAALEAEEREIFEQARASGRRESPEAYRADALVALAGRTGEEGRSAMEIVFHVDLEAFFRGGTVAGETCEIAGVGPVSMATVYEIFGESFAKVVIKRGVDPISITHLGRTIPSHLDTALRVRDRVCVVPGCGATRNLERDHWQVEVAKHGRTELDNLCRICRFHHFLRHHAGFRLEGGPGRWRWIAPHGGVGPFDEPIESASSDGGGSPRHAGTPGRGAPPETGPPPGPAAPATPSLFDVA